MHAADGLRDSAVERGGGRPASFNDSRGTRRIVFDSTPPTFEVVPFAAVTWPAWSAPNATFYFNESYATLAVGPVEDGESGLLSLRLEVFTHGLPADALVFSPNLTAGPNGTLATFVPPQPHTLYAAHLVATNAAGLTAVSPTRFLLYDPSPPIDGTVTVCDGLDPIEAQSSTSNLTLCISGARAPMSELQAYRISIYNASSGAQIGPVLEVPPLPTADGHGGLVAQLRGLELPCTAQLTVLTQAMSGAGVAAAPQSHALRTDCTPPFVKAIVTRRAHGDVELGWPRTSASCSNVHGSDLVAEWEPFDEPDGRVASYTYSLLPVVGDGPEGEAQYVGLQRHVRLGNLSSRGLSAAPGTYALRVRACNDASGCSGWSMASNELLFTSDAPGAGAITVTNAAAPGFLTNTTSLAAAWVGFDDATAAATALQHEVCVGTTPYGCQLLPLHGYPTTNDSWSNGSLPMLCGSTYYVTVRSINCAGLQRIDASTGRKLCCTPPTSGVLKLTDGDGGAVLFVGNEADLAAYWKGFVDECSGVRGYTLTLRAKADGALVWASAELPPNASVAMVPASVVGALAGDATYELTLTCTSRATLTSSVTYSFGVDWTPPEPPPPQLRWALSSAAAWRGPDEGPLCIPANASAVEVGWSASGISGFEILLSKGSSLFGGGDEEDAAWQPMGAKRSLRLATASLPSGVHLGVASVLCVRACNNAQLRLQLVGFAPAPHHATTRGQRQPAPTRKRLCGLHHRIGWSGGYRVCLRHAHLSYCLRLGGPGELLLR